MKKRTIRLLLKWAIPTNVVLFLVVAFDYLTNTSAARIPLLIVYGIFVALLLVLLMQSDRSKLVGFPNPEAEPPTNISYGQNHGRP